MAKKTYNTWIKEAEIIKKILDDAIKINSVTDIIYYRGKYINALKQINKVNPTALIPSLSQLSIQEEIKVQLNQHQITVDNAIKENKRETNVKKNTLSKEIGLRIRSLSTAIDKLKTASTEQEKKAARKEVTKSSLKLGGTTLVKAPVMAAAKVLTVAGPIAVLIATLPFTVFAGALSFFWSLSNDKEPKYSEYSNTTIHKMSSGLQSAVKSVSEGLYNTIGRI